MGRQARRAFRIALDLDGVLADMEWALIRHAEVLFGEAMPRRLQESTGDPAWASADDVDESSKARVAARRRRTAEGWLDITPPAVKAMTLRQQRHLWRHIKRIENFWETLSEVEPGVVARLARLAADERWEIVFMTKRPETAGSTAQVQTQRWLQSKGFPLPSVLTVQGSRGPLAAALSLDVVVDDRPENCVDVVADSKARAVLVWRGDENVLPAARRLGIGVVKTTAECLDVLAGINAPAPDRRGVKDRVMRLLGMAPFR